MLLNQAHKTDYEGKELVVDGKIGPRTLSALAKSTFKKGDKDAIIAWIQRRLGIPDDMDFGPQTKNAVIAFQRAHGLADDGIVGPNTWAALVQ